MSTLISVFAVRFHASEVWGDQQRSPEDILGLTATVIQAMNNRGLMTVAVGMEDGGTITMCFERQPEAGKALAALSALIQVLQGERRAWNEGDAPGDPSLN